ncbi:hypothetical protein I3843_13G057900, partial [Carya illinoinensis]
MASLTQRLFLLQMVILSLSIISTNARPCKTLFISSYSFSFKQNPSFSGVITVVTEIGRFSPRPTLDRAFPSEIFVFPVNDEVQDRPIERDDMPFGLGYKKSLSSSSNYDYSSLRDRTKDILSVVVALLFGVGCGALTATTMYLAWSLFSNCFYDFRYGSPYSDDDEDDHDDDVNTKKLGYVKIPAADSVPALAPAPAAVDSLICGFCDAGGRTNCLPH